MFIVYKVTVEMWIINSINSNTNLTVSISHILACFSMIYFE